MALRAGLPFFAAVASAQPVPDIFTSGDLGCSETRSAKSAFLYLRPVRATADVTVTLTVQDPSVASVSPTSFTFTSSDWSDSTVINEWRTVQKSFTVTCLADDAVNTGRRRFTTITATASGAEYDGVTERDQIRNADSDPYSLRIPEGRRLRLSYRALIVQGDPTATITATSSDTDVVSVSPASLSWTPAELAESSGTKAWIITIVDNDLSGDAKATVSFSYVNYPHFIVPDIQFTVTDNEDLVLDPSSLTLAEGGEASYTVRLVSEPTATVTVAITGHAGADLTLDKTSLTFTTSTWNTPQTVTVEAGQDDDLEDDVATLLHTASGGDYESETVSLPVTVTDTSRATRSDGPSRGVPMVALWTDELSYVPGDSMQLYFDIDPRGEDRDHAVFVSLVRLASGDRKWLDLRGERASFELDVTDMHGNWEERLWARPLERVERRMVWEGEVPEPGLWHFVAELRSPSTWQVLRRAYAKFLVAGAGKVLVVRRGFRRVLRRDERWSSDTIWTLGGRLIVPRGVTLEIEAGTQLRAWGPEAGIVVEPGGRIVARGRREAPIVMTCSQAVGWREPGCWSGLEVYGEAASGQWH